MPVIHEGSYYVEVLDFDIKYLKRIKAWIFTDKFKSLPIIKLEISESVSEFVVECDLSDISKIYDYLKRMMCDDC